LKVLKFCQPYLLSHKYTLITYIFISLSSTAVVILSPFIVGNFLDALIQGAEISAVLRFCAIFGGLSIIKIIKNYISSVMYVRMWTKMGHELNMYIIRHAQKLSLTYIDQQDTAYLNQKVNGDSNNVIMFCISTLQSILSNVVLFLVPLILLLTINWLISILLMGFLLVFLLIYITFKKHLYTAGLALREAQNKLFSSLFEQLKYIKLIKINSIQPEMNKRADTDFVSMQKAAIHNQKVSYVYSGSENFVSTIAQIILFIVGGIQILAGNFTIGMFTIFSSYFNMILGASKYFFGLGEVYQNTLVAYDRVKEILDQKPETCGVNLISNINKIELHSLEFSYAGQSRDTKAISNLNVSFSVGKIYAITGANGTGKSTLVSLVLGLYIDEYKGCITYNDIDIKHIDMRHIRKYFVGFAEQEPMLLKNSVRYNLCYDDINDKASDNNDMVKALSEHINTLNMQEFISSKGLDFVVNERNANTSGGEKQKIAILKVLYKDPTLMIFDEPTSALDDETTKGLVDYLQKVKKDKIIIIITHDEAVKTLCDEIVCFK